MIVSRLAPDPVLPNLQLVLVKLVAEQAVLLVKVFDSAAVLHGHLEAALHLQPQNIHHLLSLIQLQPQSLSLCMQHLALALGLFQPGKMLEKISLASV